MQGSKCLIIAALMLAGCSPNSIMKPDCHSCTVEDQEWSAFTWSDLSGQWKGSVETFQIEKDAKTRVKKEAKAELRFLTADQFLKAQGVASCSALSPEALVLNGVLWSATTGAPGKTGEFETFVPVDKNKVAYGRLSVESINGKKVCHFRRLGSVMGKNRLSLPTVTFSEYSTTPARGLASLAGEAEVSLEFLRFAPTKPLAFRADGRGPASIEEKERPPLMIRVFKVSSRNAGERGHWSGSEEQLYRLWKSE